MESNETHPAALDPEELLKCCDIRRGRRRGPGGQHRNKVETAVTIVHAPSGVQGEATERRSQQQNRRQAIFRLRVNLALACRTPKSADDEPTKLWKARSRAGKISVNPEHEDFPALLAEALNVVAARQFDLPAASEQLGLTGSQLVKFLKLESRALQQVNHERQQRGLHALR